MTKFKFPYDNGLTGDSQNKITVEAYAFADCDVLQSVYFDINMTYISDYAFADSRTDLTFYLYGSEIPATLSAKWRNKKITTYSDDEVDYNNVVYDVHFNEIKPAGEAEGYPGMTFSISHEVRMLENARTNTTSVYIIDSTEAATDYAIVSGFEAPEEEDWIEGYYYDGALTIPDRVKINGNYYYVKVIGQRAFEDKELLTEVKFNEHLVQIMHHAFYHSNNISNLDFDDCLHLKEISYCIFNEIVTPAAYANNAYEKNSNGNDSGMVDRAQTQAASNMNSLVTSITLPNSLEYLGNFAFFNFVNLRTGIGFKTNKQQPANLKIIGDYAFAVYSGDKFGDAATNNKYYKTENGGPGQSEAKVDLELPNSLDDGAAQGANIFHSFTYDQVPDVNASIWNRVAVNKNAFENQDSIRTVKMESGGTPHDISFGSNVFVRCDYMLRFEASDNLCLLGHEVFKCCHSLREVFLTTTRAKNNHSACTNGVLNGDAVPIPWGIRDGSNEWRGSSKPILCGSPYEHLIVYIKPPTDGTTFNNGGQSGYVKVESATNAGTLYTNSLTSQSRSNSPVYTIDWSASGNIKYWHLNDKPTDELVDFDNGPKTLDDYNDGYIALYKSKTTNPVKYSVARYYTDGGTNSCAKTVNLTSSTLSGITLEKIGKVAFAGTNPMGFYFVLPSSISIEERAFYRSNALTNGVRIVTFKNGNNIQVNASNVGSKTFEQIVQTIESSSNKAGYCCLPTGIKSLADHVFYNNLFGSVEISNQTTKINRTAFYTHYSGSTLWGQNQSFMFTNYSGTTTNTYMTVINNGIYYTKEADYKMLVLQSNGIEGSLTVDTGTKAIGNHAVASCRYSSVTFPNDTTIIYGQAFANCFNLATLNNISHIKYINSSVNSPDQEINTKSQYDQTNKTGTGAFQNCSNLTVDFSDMTSIVKIGESAFNGCTKIVTGLTLSKTYSFYRYTTSSGEVQIPTNSNTRIMDLSTLSNLRLLGTNAFANCNIDYVILPNTTGTTYNVVSNFKCGTTVFNNSTIKLCGETVHQADQSGQLGLNYKDHYPDGALNKDYTKLYYRIHTDADVLINPQTTKRHYWTAVKTGNSNQVKIVVFETEADATAWLAIGTNAADQCHSFPES